MELRRAVQYPTLEPGQFRSFEAVQDFCEELLGTLRKESITRLGDFPRTMMADVRVFGAVGNDETICDAAIASAIASLPNGGIVFFPPGTYRTTITIDVPSNITLHGRNARIKNITTGSFVRIIQNADTTNGNENIIIDGLEIEAFVRDVGAGEMQSNAQDGIRMEKVTNFKALNCKVFNCQYGIETVGEDCLDVEIAGNYLEGCVIYAIYGRGNGVRVVSNIVKDHGYDDGHNLDSKEAICVGIGGTYEGENNLVAFNEVTNCEHSGLAIVKMLEVSVVGNMVEDAVWGIELNNCRGVSVLGNTFKACSEYGIYYNGANPGHEGHTSERLAIIGNIIDGGEVGIGGGDYKSFDISHNMVYNWQEMGIGMGAGDVNADDIYASTATGLIQSNHVLDMDGTASGAKAIYVVGMGNVSIKDNTVRGMAAAGASAVISIVHLIDDWPNRMKNIVISGNKITDCETQKGVNVLGVHNLEIQGNQLEEDNTFGSVYDIDKVSGRLVYDKRYPSVPTGRKIGYSVGDILRYDLSTPNDTWGWICEVAGDYNADGCSGSISIGTDQLVVDDITGFYVGAHISVANAGPAGGTLYTYITAIDKPNKTFTLEDNAEATASNDDVYYVDPTHATLSYGGFMGDLVDDATPQLGGDLDLNGENIDFPTTPNISDCLDEDNMVSDSPTVLATQQSIKAYADTKLGNVVEDTTPQLGGDLDLNSKNIDFPSVANISDCKDEDNMVSDSPTMLATQQSIKAYVDAVAPSVAVGSFTRDTGLPPGTTVISGLGFQPTGIILFVNTPGTKDINFMVISNGTTSMCLIDYDFTGANTYYALTYTAISLYEGAAGTITYGAISIQSGGFTITWTKLGSPSNVTTVCYLCFG